MRWPRRWVTMIVPLGLIVGTVGGCPHRLTEPKREPEPVATFHEEIVVMGAVDSEEVGDAH